MSAITRMLSFGAATPAPVTMKAVTAGSPRAVTLNGSAEDVTPLPSTSVFTPEMHFSGSRINSTEDMVIYGKVLDTELRVRNLTVMTGGEVSGEIEAEHIRSFGTVRGKVKAGKFIAHKGSLTDGEVRCEELGVQPGCIIRARVDADQTQQVGYDPAKPMTTPTGFEAEFPAATRLQLVEVTGSGRKRA